ncbi:hypothetical protein HK100_006427, partial [Physocladia obscura]
MGGSKTKPKKKTNQKNKQKQYKAKNMQTENNHEAETEANESSASANTISRSSSHSKISSSVSVSGNESENESNASIHSAQKNIPQVHEQAQQHSSHPVKRRLDSELQSPNSKTNSLFKGGEEEEEEPEAAEEAEHLKRVCIDSKENKKNTSTQSKSGLHGDFVFEHPVSTSDNTRTIRRVDSKYSEQSPLQNPPVESSQIAENDTVPSFSVLDGFSAESPLSSSSVTSSTRQQLSPTLESIPEETDIPAAKTAISHLELDETGNATDADASSSSVDDLDSVAFDPLLSSEKLSNPNTGFVYLPVAVALILKQYISPIVKAILAKTDTHPLVLRSAKWMVIIGSAPIGLWLFFMLLPFILG